MEAPMCRKVAPLVTIALIGSLARAALAAWPDSPTTNLPVCTAGSSSGSSPTIVSDGAGGAIIAWEDNRSGTNLDIYAQHALASGDVDPVWPMNGAALCTAALDQLYPMAVSDGVGGAIVTWQDGRSGGANCDIYAQHVLASGVVDPAWPVNGAALCTSANNQLSPRIISDGAGGAIVTWFDFRGGTSSEDIYAQHVLASGVADPAWPVNGVALDTTSCGQFPAIVSDGAGGAIVTWDDFRSGGANYDIYAQHALASGVVDPAWPVNGRALCTAVNNQGDATIVSDGTGGAIVAWSDSRIAVGELNDIYAQHVLASGTVDPAWPVDGAALCTAARHQVGPVIVSDGAGGAIVTWFDYRSGSSWDIYAQHVLAAGAVDPAWPVDGAPLCTAANEQSYPTIIPDGAGGAIVTWIDYRSGTHSDIYAQHVLASGVVDPAWPVDGGAICTAANSQGSPTIVSDGTGAAIITWSDPRRGTSFDIYAQRVNASGRLGDPTSDASGQLLAEVSLAPPRPNPARGSATLDFELPQSGRARIAVYDVSGREKRELVDGLQAAGEHSVVWDLRDDAGRSVSAGLYFVRLQAEGHPFIRRIAVLK
jgi:hypothetical protein